MSQLCRSAQFARQPKSILNDRFSSKGTRDDTINFAIAVHVLQNTCDVDISRCCIAGDGKKNVQRFKTHVPNHCFAH